jgi:hypothetical protein
MSSLANDTNNNNELHDLLVEAMDYVYDRTRNGEMDSSSLLNGY